MQFQRNDKKIFGSSLQKLSAQKKTFQWTDASNCVYFSPHNLLFCADKSILRAVIWLVRLMHALYINHIGYNETPTLPVLNGPPSWVVRSTSKNGRSGARYRQWCHWIFNITLFSCRRNGISPWNDKFEVNSGWFQYINSFEHLIDSKFVSQAAFFCYLTPRRLRKSHMRRVNFIRSLPHIIIDSKSKICSTL